MAIIATSQTKEEESRRFAALMTTAQFGALATRLDVEALVHGIRNLISGRSITAAAGCDRSTVARWLVNGWSTEGLLELNQRALTGAEALRHSLHWAFPQAYYSVFAVTLGYFKAVGFTEMSHAAVIRKFGHEVVAARYPAAIAFALSGKRHLSYHGLCATTLPHSLVFDASDPTTIDGQLAQFLRATRTEDLNNKKGDHKFLTKTGRRKRAWRPDEWEVVSDKMGPTSLLSLLYRKRIKANYQDIDTFLHPEMDPHRLYEHVLGVVGGANLVHEACICKALGAPFVRETLLRLPEASRVRIQGRLDQLGDLAA